MLQHRKPGTGRNLSLIGGSEALERRIVEMTADAVFVAHNARFGLKPGGSKWLP